MARRSFVAGPKCLARTKLGGRCQNLQGSCPYHGPRRDLDGPTLPVGARSAGSKPPPAAPTLPVGAAAITQGAASGSPVLGFAARPALGPSWPGVGDDGGPLLRDNAADFQGGLDRAVARFGVPAASIVRDYHMCRTLRALFAEQPPGASFFDRYDDHKGRPVAYPVGPVLFTGGSSLTNAYRLADRISEDIDLAVALTDEIDSKSALSRIRRLVVVDTARACSPELADDAHNKRTTGGDIGRRVITVGQTENYLIAEASIIRPFDAAVQSDLDQAAEPFSVCRIVACQSLMGRADDAGLVADYQELAPFEVAALCVPFTAANKFFALHGRAMAEPTEESLADLAKRARDVYDLWSVAQSAGHAIETRAALPALARHIHPKGATKEPYPRPEGGFSESPAFESGTPQYKTLQTAYTSTLQLVWGRRPPSFAEAVTAIKTLD